MPNMGELILKSIIDAIPMMWEVFSPILIPMIKWGIILAIITYIATKIVSNFSMLIGDTRRETRRKVKTTRNLIDLLSAISDIRPRKK